MVMRRTLCFDSAQLMFLLSRSAQQFFPKPNTCRLNCQHWICMCVSLSESYFCDSLALMAFQKPLIPLSCPVLPLSPELTHMSCVFQDATWLTDGSLPDQEGFFPPELSRLKPGKFASSFFTARYRPWLGGVADFDNSFGHQMERAKGFWSELRPKGRLDRLYRPSCGLCKPAPGYWNKERHTRGELHLFQS